MLCLTVLLAIAPLLSRLAKIIMFKNVFGSFFLGGGLFKISAIFIILKATWGGGTMSILLNFIPQAFNSACTPEPQRKLVFFFFNKMSKRMNDNMISTNE